MLELRPRSHLEEESGSNPPKQQRRMEQKELPLVSDIRQPLRSQPWNPWESLRSFPHATVIPSPSGGGRNSAAYTVIPSPSRDPWREFHYDATYREVTLDLSRLQLSNTSGSGFSQLTTTFSPSPANANDTEEEPNVEDLEALKLELEEFETMFRVFAGLVTGNEQRIGHSVKDYLSLISYDDLMTLKRLKDCFLWMANMVKGCCSFRCYSNVRFGEGGNIFIISQYTGMSIRLPNFRVYLDRDFSYYSGVEDIVLHSRGSRRQLNISPSPSTKGKRAKIYIPLETLQLHYDKTLEQASKEMFVSVSKLKDAVKDHGYGSWSDFKLKTKLHLSGKASHSSLTTSLHVGDVSNTSGLPVLNPSDQYKCLPVTKHKRVVRYISLENIEPHYNKTRKQAAAALGISRRQLMETLNDYGHHTWPKFKRAMTKKHKSGKATIPPNVVSPPEASETTMQQVVMQDYREAVTVKATDGETNIKFKLFSSSKMEDLNREVMKGLDREVESFELKYVDEDGDLIRLRTDANLTLCMDTLRSLGLTKVKMLVLPIPINPNDYFNFENN